MGCNTSRQKGYMKLMPSASTINSYFARGLTPAMIQPPTPSGQVASQHERLILELLPFNDVALFHEWLHSVFVRGAWHEFCRDFLASNPLAPEPDKLRAAQNARDAFNTRKVQYLLYHPEKDGWTSEDHHTRFIVTVIADNLLKGLWSESEWKKKGLDISKAVYEVLSYLRTTIGPEQQAQLRNEQVQPKHTQTRQDTETLIES